MDVQTSLNRIEELFRIMYLGLWVLWTETRWIAGPDIGYQRRLTLMRRRQEAIQDELSRMATLADPRRGGLSGLFRAGRCRLQAGQGRPQAVRAGHLAPLRARFGWLL